MSHSPRTFASPFARFACAAAIAVAALFAASAPAKAEVIERVVAVIGSEAVFLSELRRRAAPFLATALQAPTEAERMAAIETLYTEVLDRMVQEELFIQAAERMSVTVSRSEVDRAIANVQRQSNLNDAQFWEAVAGQGFTADQYRDDVRRQLLRLKVLNTRARGRVNITEEQVQERYRMLLARSRRTAEFDAAHIFIEVPTGASATETSAARRRAEDLRDGLASADDFWDEGGESLGRLSQGSLPTVLEDALMNLSPGELSPVVRGPSGFHIFLLEGRQQAAQSVPPYDEVRMQVYQQMMEEAMGEQEELFITELRRQAVIDLRL